MIKGPKGHKGQKGLLFYPFCCIIKVPYVLFVLYVSLVLFSKPLSAEFPSTSFTLETGYRQDHLIWNIGHPSGTPNILSELQWNDVQIWNTAASLKIITDTAFYVRAFADYGQVFAGTNQDSDYSANNRQEEYSRSLSSAKPGYVYDLSLSFGRQFQFCQNRLKLSPLVGYSLNAQRFSMKHGTQIVDAYSDDEDLGSFEGLNSRYLARWFGPFIGLDIHYQASPKILLNAFLEYHFARFNGFGHWNLRREFYRDFEHTANGEGFISSIGALYQLTRRLSFGLNFNYELFKAGNGIDRTYILHPVKGELKKMFVDCPFISVKWRSFSILASAKLQF